MFCALALGITILTIPIAIFVVAPWLSQRIIYATDIALPNSTMLPCSGANAMLINTANITVPGPFSATLHPYKTKLSVTMCGSGADTKGGWACSNPNITELGTYMAPEMKLQPGKNQLEFKVGMDLVDPTQMLEGFISPLFIGSHKVTLIIESEHIDMVAGLMGIQIKIQKMKMRNELTCHKVQIHDPSPLPDSICYPHGAPPSSSVPSSVMRGRRLNDTSSGYEMLCTAGLQKNLTFFFV
jgi:hypothetical protein